MIFYKLLPHKTPCTIICMRKENMSVKKAFHIFLASFMRFRWTSDNQYSSVIFKKLFPPSYQSFLDPWWSIGIFLSFSSFCCTCFLLFLFLLFLAWKYFLTFINVNNWWLVVFGYFHYWGNEFLFTFWLSVSIINC